MSEITFGSKATFYTRDALVQKSVSGRVLGIDISEGMIAEAVRTNSEEQIYKIFQLGAETAICILL
jgi:ubiquinone/menaquinone biosynthesis C-methylase UbiE